MTADELAHQLLALTPPPPKDVDPAALLAIAEHMLHERAQLIEAAGDVIGRAHADLASAVHALDAAWLEALVTAHVALANMRGASRQLGAYTAGAGPL
jgi:hypothetical protein